jgi:cyclophilin family peptidyl-prolyl cis-trans isomerase
MEEQVALLNRLVIDVPKAPVTPYALIEMASIEARLRRYDAARATLDRIRKEFPDFIVSRSTTADFGDPAAIPLADRLDATLRSEAEWAKLTAYVHPEPTKNRAALIETTAGAFWIGFYPDHAPRHVEEFVSLAKSGWFNGTQVYHTRTNLAGGSPSPMLFEAGSTASKVNHSEYNADPSLHDQDEPDFTIEPEDSRYTIRHRRGVVCSVTMASGESARRFAVITAPGGMETSFRGRNTIFGAVLEKESSLEAAERITMSPTFGSVAETRDNPTLSGARDHPNPPVFVRRVSIWLDEQLEPGHTWDTARVGKPDAEPWEQIK